MAAESKIVNESAVPEFLHSSEAEDVCKHECSYQKTDARVELNCRNMSFKLKKVSSCS